MAFGDILAQERKNSDGDDEYFQWPSYLGPHGNFSAKSNVPLIDDISKIKLLWESEEQTIGFGKTWIGTFPRVPKTLGNLPPGGVSSPIVANGLVIQSYFKPSGTIYDKYIEKTLPENEFLKDRWLVLADDIILAVDANTGKTRWKKVFADRGLNLVSIKYGGWGITPVASNGRLFSIGTAGRVYCLDLETGELLWESNVGDKHVELEELRSKALADHRLVVGNGRDRPRITLLGGMIVVDNVLIAPDLNQGLIGLDTKTGRILWHLKEKITSEYNMPVPVETGQKKYVAAVNAAGALQLLNPKNGKILWKLPLESQHLTQLIAGNDHLLVFKAHPTYRGSLIKNPPEEQAATELAARYAGVNRYGLLAAFHFDEKGAYKDWELPEEYIQPLHMDKGSDRRLIANNGLIYFINVAREPEQFQRLLIISEKDGKILHDEPVGADHIWLWGDRLITATDIRHRASNERPEIWQMYAAYPESFRALGNEWHINDPKKLVHIPAGGYEVPIYEPFVNGLMFCRTIGGIRCYDLRR